MNEHGQVYFEAEQRIPKEDRERFRAALAEDRDRAAAMLEAVEQRELLRLRIDAAKRTEESVQDMSEQATETREALEEVVSWQVILHPLPWRVESDWTQEVVASDGYCIAKCRERATAEQIVALAEAA